MGVMSCSRRGCQSIMCDTYVPSIGYICFGCQKDFKSYIIHKNIVVNSKEEIMEQLKKFTEIEKGSFDSGEQISVEEFFREHTNY